MYEIFLVPNERLGPENLFCVELNSQQCLIKNNLAKQQQKILIFYQINPLGLEGLYTPKARSKKIMQSASQWTQSAAMEPF